MKIKYDCGCEFESDDGKNIVLEPSLESYLKYLGCPKTWELLSSGRTQGVFQLESPLGKTWAKKLRPSSEEHMSALVALLRPGCLQSIGEDGKNMTQHYVDRKNGLEESTSYDPALDECLADSYNILVYQEGALKIAQKIAGFTGNQSDNLRKSIGKKDTELMAKVEKEFIEGVKKTNIVTEEVGRVVFDWIRKSQRYSFNKCVSPATVVETDNQELKTLDELQVGEMVKCPNSKYAKVLRKYDQGLQEIYRVKTDSGKEIECTLTHKFLCEDGKIRELSNILENNHKIQCEED